MATDTDTDTDMEMDMDMDMDMVSDNATPHMHATWARTRTTTQCEK